MSLFKLKIISHFILFLYNPGRRAVEQGIINLAYWFGDDLLTIVDHH